MENIDSLTLILIGALCTILLFASGAAIHIGNLMSRKDNRNGSHR